MTRWWMLVLLAGGAPAAAQELEWRVTERLRFTQRDQVVLADVRGIAVAPGGVFFVLDRMNSAVYAFAPDGELLRTIGRRGAGPGELSNRATLLAYGAGRLAVLDRGNARITSFDTLGAHTGDLRRHILQAGMTSGLGALPDGSLVEQRQPVPLPAALRPEAQAPPTPVLVRLAPDGTVRDTIARFDAAPLLVGLGGAMPRVRLPDDLPVWTVTADGRVVYGQADRYVLTVWDPSSSTTTSWTRAVGRRPVTDAYREHIRRAQEEALARMATPPAQVRAMIENTVFPDSLPLILRLVPGPFGTVLVGRGPGLVDRWADDARAVDETGPTSWDVLDAQGRLLGVLRLPARFQPYAAQHERIYGVQLDADDVPWVVVLAVAR